MNMQNEIWKDIKGFEGHYKISNTGKVFSIKSNKLLVLPIDRYGYKKVTLMIRGKHFYFTVHRLVSINFIPNTFNLPQVNHIDGNKLNNNDFNLEWCTDKENKIHAWSTGLAKPHKQTEENKKLASLRQLGENNTIAKLNNDQVRLLRNDFINGLKRKDIAKKYNISLRTVFRVANGEYYSNVI